MPTAEPLGFMEPRLKNAAVHTALVSLSVLQLLLELTALLRALLRAGGPGRGTRKGILYTVSQKKLCQCYFVNNSVKHWPNLIIFGMQHRKET